MTTPTIKAFFDEATNTISYVASDPDSRKAALIDSVLDFDHASGRTATHSADAMLDYLRSEGLKAVLILETHLHADHLTAAPYLKEHTGAAIAIGDCISNVQQAFSNVFNVGPTFPCDGSQFDRLFRDGDTFALGGIECRAMHTPGHTPACMVYVIGDAAFVGDTLFMPDFGTARCDFPGGDARALYASIKRIFELPDTTRLFMCHDYKAPGRDDFAWETTVAEQRTSNVHVHDGVGEEEFVAMREGRDAKLSMPKLILPSVQVNMRGGEFPPPEDNGVAYLKLPLNGI